MTVCKFFAQGHCRYGNSCWNEHTRPGVQPSTPFDSTNRFNSLAGHEGGSKEALALAHNPFLNHGNAPSIVDEIIKEMEIWEKSGMWLFSCFGFAKDVPCLPGFDDFSPEEMRLKAYEEKARGSIANYEVFWKNKVTEVRAKLQTLRHSNPQLKQQLLERVRSIQTEVLHRLGAQAQGQAAATTKNVFAVSTTSASNPFGATLRPATMLGATTASTIGSTTVFGAAATPGTNLFGGPVASGSSLGTTSLFGSATTTASVPSLFGTASRSQPPASYGTGTQSSFGAAPVFGSGVFGAATSKSSHVFGSAAANHSSNVFGSPMVSTTISSATPSTFGTPGSSSIFGAANSATPNLFGSPAKPITANVFGAAPTAQPTLQSGATPNLFGASTTTQTAFGNAFGAPAPQSLGATQTNATFGSLVFQTATTGATTTPFAVSSAVGGGSSVTTTSVLPAAAVLVSKTPNPFPILDGFDAFLPQTTTYTDIAELTPAEKEQFAADEFTDLMKIPLRPPPREFV